MTPQPNPRRPVRYIGRMGITETEKRKGDVVRNSSKQAWEKVA